MCKQNNEPLCAKLVALTYHAVHFAVSHVHLFCAEKLREKKTVDNLHTINSTNDPLAKVIFFSVENKNKLEKVEEKSERQTGFFSCGKKSELLFITLCT